MTLIKIAGEWVNVGGNMIWQGTKAQLAEDLAAGKIPDGTMYHVTDDYVKPGYPGEKRTGTVTVTPQDNEANDFQVNVTFASPMPSANYIVDITSDTESWHASFIVKAKTKNGFTLEGLLTPLTSTRHFPAFHVTYIALEV